jgi:alpha-1,6-mannosyltransferase
MAPETRPHLLFVGEGPSAPAFQALARDRHDFSVLPFVSDREELARIYASADLYLASGPGETFGLSVAEALASGLPVVAVDSGAVPDRIRGSGAGELYSRGEAESARRALERMLERLGPALRDRARAHAVVEYGWERSFDALLGLYASLAEARKAA